MVQHGGSQILALGRMVHEDCMGEIFDAHPAKIISVCAGGAQGSKYLVSPLQMVLMKEGSLQTTLSGKTSTR